LADATHSDYWATRALEQQHVARLDGTVGRNRADRKARLDGLTTLYYIREEWLDEYGEVDAK
jgi:hypothetical protein